MRSSGADALPVGQNAPFVGKLIHHKLCFPNSAQAPKRYVCIMLSVHPDKTRLHEHINSAKYHAAIVK